MHSSCRRRRRCRSHHSLNSLSSWIENHHSTEHTNACTHLETICPQWERCLFRHFWFGCLQHFFHSPNFSLIKCAVKSNEKNKMIYCSIITMQIVNLPVASKEKNENEVKTHPRNMTTTSTDTRQINRAIKINNKNGNSMSETHTNSD